MLGRFNRLRRHIRYHSAPRPVNGWSRAIDIAFIASFLLATPAAIIADVASRDARSGPAAMGIIARSADGRVNVRLTDAAGGASVGGSSSRASGGSDVIVGNFNLTVVEHLRGWPLVTTIDREPAMLTLDIVAEPKARPNVPRDPTDDYQRAIATALDVDDLAELQDAWDLREVRSRRQWWAWFPAIGAWWILLFAFAGITIQSLRFGSLWLRGKRMERAYRRRTQNKCAACGYDLTGLDFNERCPECGAQVW